MGKTVKKSHKEKPRNKTQRQYERDFKFSYYNMLKNMGKTLIYQLDKFERNDTVKPAAPGTI